MNKLWVVADCYRDRRHKLPEFDAREVDERGRYTGYHPLRLEARLLHAYEELEGVNALAVFSEPNHGLEYLTWAAVDGQIQGSAALIEATQEEIQKWIFKGDSSGLCVLDPPAPFYREGTLVAVSSLNESVRMAEELEYEDMKRARKRRAIGEEHED